MSKITSLELGRGLAALGVTIFHAAEALPSSHLPELVQRLYLGGQTGIYFFFVLSGFVMHYAHRRDFDVPDRLPRYLAKRVNRIYPIYWLVLAAILPMYFLFPAIGLPEFREWPTLLSAFFLIGDPSPTPLTVAWTLFHEMLFYLLFAMLLFSRRLGATVLATWLAACAANIVIGIDSYIIAPVNLLFGFGMAVGWLTARRTVPAPLALLVLGGILYAGVILVGGDISRGPSGAILFGLTSALLILGLFGREDAGQLTVPQPLILLGGASYVLYLIHGPLISLCGKIWTRLGLGDQHTAFVAVMCVVCVIASILVHRLIEKPLLQGGNKLIKTLTADPNRAGKLDARQS